MKMLQAFNENSGMGDVLQDAPEMAAAMMRYLPLRALVAFSGGEFSEETMAAMLANLNSMTA
jgi:beta-glucosidase